MAPLRAIFCACAVLWQIDMAHALRKNKESSGKVGALAAEAAEPGACAGVRVEAMYSKEEAEETYTCTGPDGAELELESECCQEFLRCEEEAPEREADYRKLLGLVMKGCALQAADYTRAGDVTHFDVSERLCTCDLAEVMGKEFKDKRDGRRAFQGAPLNRDVFWLPQPFRRNCFDFEETSAKVKAASDFVHSVLSAFDAVHKCPKICDDGEYPESCVVPFPPWAGSPALMPEKCRGDLLVLQLPKNKEQYYVPLRVKSAGGFRELDIRRMKGSRTGDFVRIQRKDSLLDLELVGKGSAQTLAQTDKLELGLKGAKAPSDQHDPPAEKASRPS